MLREDLDMNLHPSFRFLLVTLLAISWSDPGATAETSSKGPTPAAASANKVHKPLAAETPKSVFNPIQGRNPFFPATTVQPIQTTPGTQPPPKTTQADQLVLNGIIPKGPKVTAMINGYTFEEGDTAEVKLPNGTKLQIKCEEIRAESAIISIDGQKRELKLRFGAF